MLHRDPHVRAHVASQLVAAGVFRYDRENPCTFRGGTRSPVYMDCRRVQGHVGSRTAIARAISTAAQRMSAEVIAGIQNGAIPHSVLVADLCELPHASLRKEDKRHGVQGMVEGADVCGKRVLVFEDMVSKGGSALRGIRAAKEAGGKIAGCITILSYDLDGANEQITREAGIFIELVGLADILSEVKKQPAARFTSAEEADVLSWHKDPHAWLEAWQAERDGLGLATVS